MSGVPALWTKHQALARSIANEWFIPGSDRDDVRQEAQIALWVATLVALISAIDYYRRFTSAMSKPPA